MCVRKKPNLRNLPRSARKSGKAVVRSFRCDWTTLSTRVHSSRFSKGPQYLLIASNKYPSPLDRSLLSSYTYPLVELQLLHASEPSQRVLKYLTIHITDFRMCKSVERGLQMLSVYYILLTRREINDSELVNALPLPGRLHGNIGVHSTAI